MTFSSREGDGRGIVRAEHVDQGTTLKSLNVAAGYVTVVGETVLLLADGELHGIAEHPSYPELGEAVIHGFKITSTDGLRMEDQVIKKLGLSSDSDTA